MSRNWFLEMMLKQGAPGPEVLAHVMQIAWNTEFDSQQRLSRCPMVSWGIHHRAMSARHSKSSVTFEVNWCPLDIENPPSHRGVYAAFDEEGLCLYIERSQNIRTRLKNRRHPIQILKDIKMGQKYYWVKTEEGEDEWVESALIWRLNPLWNGGTSWNGAKYGAQGPICECNCVSSEELLAAIGC